MPPDVRDWLPEGHLAWFVLDAVAGMDLGGFYAAYRADGVGRRAYDPAMLVALLLYGYSRGVRSAREIERACWEDVAFKTIAMLETPDHATIARFVARHEARWPSCSVRCSGCAHRRGWSARRWSRSMGRRWRGTPAASPPVTSRRSPGRSSLRRTRPIEAEDELYGDQRGDELPEELRTREGRAEFFRRRPRAAGCRQEHEEPELGAGTGPRIRRMGSRSMCSGSLRVIKGARVGRVRVAGSSSSALGATGNRSALARGAAAARGPAVGGAA